MKALASIRLPSPARGSPENPAGLSRDAIQAILSCLALFLLCLASGNLECGSAPLTEQGLRGQELYVRICAVCHGRWGEGYAADRAPALANPEFLASAKDEFIRNAIEGGRRGTTMSAWSVSHGGPLSSADVAALIAFMRTWEDRAPAPLDESPHRGDASRGLLLFGADCVACHGARGTGGPYVHIGDPELLAAASDGFLRYAMAQGRRGTPMPSFRDQLGAAGAEDLLALLRGWQTSADRPLPLPPPRAARIPLPPLPMNPDGPEPAGLQMHPAMTSLEVIKGQIDRGARLGILDARAPSDYLGEHIAGAANVPFYDPDAFLAELPRDAWLVCYCGCPHAESGQLAGKLVAKGFKKVTVLDEGFNAWKAKGYAIHSGLAP